MDSGFLSYKVMDAKGSMPCIRANGGPKRMNGRCGEVRGSLLFNAKADRQDDGDACSGVGAGGEGIGHFEGGFYLVLLPQDFDPLFRHFHAQVQVARAVGFEGL